MYIPYQGLLFYFLGRCRNNNLPRQPSLKTKAVPPSRLLHHTHLHPRPRHKRALFLCLVPSFFLKNHSVRYLLSGVRSYPTAEASLPICPPWLICMFPRQKLRAQRSRCCKLCHGQTDTSLFSNVDVLVIGAGPTGLGAAKRLNQIVRGSGLNLPPPPSPPLRGNPIGTSQVS